MLDACPESFRGSCVTRDFTCHVSRLILQRAPKASSDGLSEFLAVGRIGNEAGLAGIGEVTALDKDGGTLLAAQHAGKPSSADAAVAIAGDLQYGAMHLESQLEVLRVKGVVGKDQSLVIAESTRDGGRHARGGEAIGF